MNNKYDRGSKGLGDYYENRDSTEESGFTFIFVILFSTLGFLLLIIFDTIRPFKN